MTASRSSRWLAVRDLALDCAAVKSIAVLGAAGIDALLLKGPVTAARLYPGETGDRHYRDVDLLVAPSDFHRAEATLAAAGYRRPDEGVRPSERLWRETSWRAPDGCSIDLHRSLAFVTDPDALWAALWRDRTSLDVCGAPVPVPDLTGTALIVALHATRPGKGDKARQDLERAVTTLDDHIWSAMVELAEEVGAVDAAAFGLGSVDAARPLVERLGLHVDGPLAWRLAHRSRSAAAKSMSRLLELDTWPERLRHVVARVFPSPASMRRHWPVARRGRLGLARAYGQRLGLLARSAPQGMKELRAALRPPART